MKIITITWSSELPLLLQGAKEVGLDIERRVAFILHNNPCVSVEASVGRGAHLDTLESVARIMNCVVPKVFRTRFTPGPVTRVMKLDQRKIHWI